MQPLPPPQHQRDNLGWNDTGGYLSKLSSKLTRYMLFGSLWLLESIADASCSDRCGCCNRLQMHAVRITVAAGIDCSNNCQKRQDKKLKARARSQKREGQTEKAERLNNIGGGGGV